MASTSPRIGRGAALLDQTAPGWEGKIDLDILDLGHSSYCILGQVYGDYTGGLETLDGDAERKPGHFGFLAYGNERTSSLTDRWRRFIETRRKTSAAA